MRVPGRFHAAMRENTVFEERETAPALSCDPVSPVIVTVVSGGILQLVIRVAVMLFDAEARGLLWPMVLVRNVGLMASKALQPLITPSQAVLGGVIGDAATVKVNVETIKVAEIETVGADCGVALFWRLKDNW